MSMLRTKMVDVMQLCGLSRGTQGIYVNAVAQLARFYGRSPDQITPEEVQGYLVHLMKEERYSHSMHNCIVSGLRFFYRRVLQRPDVELWIPRRRTPQRLPEVLSFEELQQLFAAARTSKQRALLMTTYAAGLRVSEVTHLQVGDIDSTRMVIRIRQGKGAKDRYTILTQALLLELRAYWKEERPRTWLFPSTDPEVPMSRGAAGRLYSQAKKRAGITKSGGIHSLRHCFATQLIESGVPTQTVQVLLGHSSARSTARYVHVARAKVEEQYSLLERVRRAEQAGESRRQSVR